ncbi:MAG: HAD-IA family hydrolase [Clostridiales bacterium]|nr:HAD-IA family hydrolase [Clostridiales bacterium]
MVRAVIFDLDDTLIPEMQYIESGYQHIAKIISDKFKISRDEVFKNLLALFKEDPKNVFDRFMSLHKINYTRNIISNLVEEYRNHFPKICFYDDVLCCLNYLKSQNIKVGIITDGYANAQSQKIKAVKAHEYFDEIILTDELGREYWKPHPRAFKEMCSKLKVNFNEMIYVGDNPEKDFYISAIYPIITIRINRENAEYELIHKDKKYYKGIEEHHRITNLEELINLIRYKNI